MRLLPNTVAMLHMSYRNNHGITANFRKYNYKRQYRLFNK